MSLNEKAKAFVDECIGRGEVLTYSSETSKSTDVDRVIVSVKRKTKGQRIADRHIDTHFYSSEEGNCVRVFGLSIKAPDCSIESVENFFKTKIASLIDNPPAV